MLRFWKLSMLAAICAVLSVPAFAANEKKAGEKKEIKSRMKESASAATIDFRDAFNLTFESLTTLGARIE